MPNTALNRTGVAVLVNKSGGSVAQGDTVVVDTANANAFTTTTTSGFVNGLIGVVLEPNGIANNASGLVAFGTWIPKINLNTAATIGQFVKHHSVAKQGTPHSAPMVAGDFAVALEASATPKAMLLGSIFQGLTSLSNIWVQDINEDGSSLANWTVGDGTWVTAGGVIKQTDTATNWRTLRYTTKQGIGAGYVFESDVKMVSGSSTLRMLGLVIGYAGTDSSQGAAADIRITAGAVKEVTLSRAFTTDLLSLSPQNWGNEDQFYNLRLVSTGGLLSVYLGGVLLGSAGQFPANAGDARYVGLISYGCEAHFQNIKGYRLLLP